MNKIFRTLFILCSILLAALMNAPEAYAQTVLKGTVIGSDNNLPLPGVTIHLKDALCPTAVYSQ